jgi:hypothetical protein
VKCYGQQEIIYDDNYESDQDEIKMIEDELNIGVPEPETVSLDILKQVEFIQLNNKIY